MNRYVVIRRDSIEELEVAVNAYVNQKGYEPQGGIVGVVTTCPIRERSEVVWSQALWQRVIDVR